MGLIPGDQSFLWIYESEVPDTRQVQYRLVAVLTKAGNYGIQARWKVSVVWNKVCRPGTENLQGMI